MKRKAFLAIMLTLILTSMLTSTFNIQTVKASGTIYIRSDGSVEPIGAPIQKAGDVYTFTADIYDSIIVERDNIVIDGAGYTVQGTGASGSKGITLSYRNYVTIKNMVIREFEHGIYVSGSQWNRISMNIITANNWFGIRLESSSNYNSISGNNITNNADWGIWLDYSHDISIVGNNIANNSYGIRLLSSSNNSISGNTFTNDGLSVFDSYQNSVENNTVNGRPLVYLEGVSNYTVDDAGQVVLVRCENIRVEGLNLSRTDVGVELWATSNSTISGNNIANNSYGIFLSSSSNYNSISGNNIANTDQGIFLSSSSNNSIYHNNFVNNTPQVNSYESINVWDDGYPLGGNYWGDYLGRYPDAGEIDYSGIWDTPYVIDEPDQDNYPLMYRWPPIETSINATGTDYPATILSNTGIEEIVATANTLSFTSSGPDGEIGYVRVIFPMINTTEIKVFIDGEELIPPPFPVINTNGTHYFIYFEFTLSTHDIAIQFASPIVSATVDIAPNSLNLRSRGKWITAYIELPEGYNVADIDVSSIMLNNTVPAEAKPIAVGDFDNDAVPDLMVKFDRISVINYILSVTGTPTRFDTVTLTIMGKLIDNTPFEGSCTIKIIM